MAILPRLAIFSGKWYEWSVAHCTILVSIVVKEHIALKTTCTTTINICVKSLYQSVKLPVRKTAKRFVLNFGLILTCNNICIYILPLPPRGLCSADRPLKIVLLTLVAPRRVTVLVRCISSMKNNYRTRAKRSHRPIYLMRNKYGTRAKGLP